MFSRLLADVHHALRIFARNPGFTSVVVITLTLGIGVTTAVFGIFNGVLLRPLPYAEPERLVWVWGNVRGGSNRASVSPASSGVRSPLLLLQR